MNPKHYLKLLLYNHLFPLPTIPGKRCYYELVFLTKSHERNHNVIFKIWVLPLKRLFAISPKQCVIQKPIVFLLLSITTYRDMPQ